MVRNLLTGEPAHGSLYISALALGDFKGTERMSTGLKLDNRLVSNTLRGHKEKVSAKRWSLVPWFYTFRISYTFFKSVEVPNECLKHKNKT